MILKSYEIIKNKASFLKFNAFLLYGENYGLKKEIKEIITDSINNQDKNKEILSLNDENISNNEENFYNFIFSGSLFGEKKILIINSSSDKIIRKMEEIIEKIPENVVLIVFSEILEKKSKLRNFFEKNSKTACVACYPDTERDLEIIATRELRSNNLSLTRESLNLIIEKSNNDRNNLKGELEKIKSYSLNKKKINIEEIKSLINFSGDYKSDSLINECLCGNITQYKKILSELYINTINHVYLLRILSNKIQRLLKLKEIENDFDSLDSLINSSKPPIFWKEKQIVRKQLSIWKLNDLKRVVDKINETELSCKTNPLISNIIFYNFFSELCKKANNFS